MTDKRIIFSTTSSRDEAQTIARALVDAQLAACVQIIGPIQSIYRWKDGVEESEEFLLIMKTTVTTIAGLRDELTRLHSYEIPECVEVPIESGLPAYLEWIGENVR